MKTIKTSLQILLAQAYEAALAFAANLSEEERQTSGDPDHWAPKDVLAHIATWTAHEVDNLAASDQGESPSLSDNLDLINAEVFAQHRDWSWEQVLQHLEQAYRLITDVVQTMHEEDLQDPARYSWTNGRPIYLRLAFTAYWHPLSHLSYQLLEFGEQAAAESLAVQSFHGMCALDDSSIWQATQTYNLACYYAQSGNHGKALDLLRQAFPGRPDLAIWASQDSELASLWENAEFQALIEPTVGESEAY